jgi:hypothetical protein
VKLLLGHVIPVGGTLRGDRTRRQIQDRTPRSARRRVGPVQITSGTSAPERGPRKAPEVETRSTPYRRRRQQRLPSPQGPCSVSIPRAAAPSPLLRSSTSGVRALLRSDILDHPLDDFTGGALSPDLRPTLTRSDLPVALLTGVLPRGQVDSYDGSDHHRHGHPGLHGGLPVASTVPGR